MQRIYEMPFGTLIDGDVCKFRLWAPGAQHVTLRVNNALLEMKSLDEGWWEQQAPATAGTPYSYRVDDRDVPDPAARAQAEDVHGASLIIDPTAFIWHDDEWPGRHWGEAVIYELHVGTFSPEGTFRGVIDHLDHLVDLGVTAIELMPVADFPGRRNWGYDGVLLFAPDRRYGTPEDLKTLVEAAHRHGLMVLLDVVYNHFGPEGNYLHLYAPQFFTKRHCTPWGDSINFDGPSSRQVREFYIHNALYWLEEFHMDGLRFDAVHAVKDDSSPDILEAIGVLVQERIQNRHVHLVLENDNNVAKYMRPPKGGFAAQWNDDFHHCLHVITTGEEGGYYEDFADAPHSLIARCLSEGFAFQGEYSAYRGRQRGELSRDLPVTAFVNFLQNHDQIGNRAQGERLSLLTSETALRAATAVLLLAPAPPLIFMGQEWGSTQPFPFFCDFSGDLGRQVTEGRRREFSRFLDFVNAGQQSRMPDPQAPETTAAAVLDWQALRSEKGKEWFAFHRNLLTLRGREIVPRSKDVKGMAALTKVLAEGVIAARWQLRENGLLLLANLSSDPVADLTGPEDRLLYATPEAFLAEDVLSGWGVAWYLVEDNGSELRFNGETVFM